MAAFVVFVRSNTTDPSGLDRYASIAKDAPISKLQLVASSKISPLQVLEGPDPDSVVIMQFPTKQDALEWYESEAYQKARPFRMAVSECQAYLLEGVG